MTITNFREGMKKVPEGKSSSLSGRNYSIYKPMLPDNYFTGKVVDLINNGVTYGFILKRWRKVLQVMLCKKPGNYNIDKLHVIQLIEADLNMYFCLVWGKRLVHHARKLGCTPPEQFSSVPGRQAASALLLNVLSFDLIQLLRTTATVFNNDATACYDRILPALSMICCQHLGLPPIATKFKLAFLRTAQYYIKTQYGTSDEWFGNAISEVFGVLQGSGAAPAVWLAASIVLIRAYNKLFPTNGIPNPTSSAFLTKIIDAFVDDTDLWDVLYGIPTTAAQAMTRMQTRAQAWERLMFSSGGKLNLKKCFWYFIAWKWTDGIPSIATINDYPGELQILSGFNPTPVTIDRIEASSALETLGLFTSPSGQNIKQFQETEEKLLSLISTVRQTPLCTFEADMLLPIYIRPGLRYIFAGTTFDEDTCKVFDRLFLPTLKSKMGYKHTTKLAIMHGSHRYGRAQLPTCWDLQGSTHLSMLIGHLQLNDIAGQYLLHEMDYLYLHIGF
jgi:hypothetical protein